MMRMSLIAVLLAFVTQALGCSKIDNFPNWPTFVMTVPDDIPDTVVITEKDGTQHEENGKNLWMNAYHCGWKACVEAFDAGRLKLDCPVSEDEVPFNCGPPIWWKGYSAGYMICWQLINQKRE